MPIDGLDDGFHNIAVGTIAALHVDMRLLVSRPPLLRETFQRALGILCPQQRARVAPGCAACQYVHWSIEPHGNRSLVEQLPNSRVDEDSPSGGDHAHPPIDQAGDQTALAVTEVAFTEALVNLGGRIAGSVLYGCVAVDERQAKAAGKAAPDGRLADPHESNQDDRTVETLGQFLHGTGLYSAVQARQKPLQPSH